MGQSSKRKRLSNKRVQRVPVPHVPSKRLKTCRETTVDKNLQLLNTNKTSHQKDFESEVKSMCDDQEMRMKKKSLGRGGSFFSRYRYDQIVRVMKLEKSMKRSVTNGKKYNRIKEELSAVNFIWNQFKLKGSKLYRPSKLGIKRCGGTIKTLNMSAMTEDHDWDEVICIDDKRTFKLINDLHWDDNPKKHKRSNQLHLHVSAKYGLNFPDVLCKILMKHCPVCKSAHKPKKKNNPNIAIDSTNQNIPIESTNISLANSSICQPVIPTTGNVSFTVISLEDDSEELVYDLDQHLILIILVEDNQFFNVSLLYSDELADLSNNMTQFFTTIGYPKNLRYVVDKEDPVSISKNAKLYEKGDVCDLLIKDAKTQFPMVSIDMVKLDSSVNIPNVLYKASKFCRQLATDFMHNTLPFGLSIEEWIARINRFINDYESMFVHKESKVLVKDSNPYLNFLTSSGTKETAQNDSCSNVEKESSPNTKTSTVEPLQLEEDNLEDVRQPLYPEVVIRNSHVEKPEEKERKPTSGQYPEDNDDNISTSIENESFSRHDTVPVTACAKPDNFPFTETKESDEDSSIASQEIVLPKSPGSQLEIVNSPEKTSKSKSNAIVEESDSLSEDLSWSDNDSSSDSEEADQTLVQVQFGTTQKKDLKENKDRPSIITLMKPKVDLHRKKVKATDKISKLATISKKNKMNQCYVNAVFQMLIGMSELWEDIIVSTSKISITEYIVNYPFTVSGLVMGGLMKCAVKSDQLPIAIKSDVLFYCRKKHLDFGDFTQEDGSEYMGQYMDRLKDEHKNGNVGRTFKITSCTRRKCKTCKHDYCGKTVDDTHFNMGIADEFWKKESCSLQELVNYNFSSTSPLDGFKCPNESCGIMQDGNYSTEINITDTPLDLILVLKRYKVQNDQKKAQIDVDALETIQVPHWPSHDLKVCETYYLRCIVCHKGNNYNEGHYVALFVEDIGEEEKIYHEINDDIHWQLTKECFSKKVKADGYIFHYSKRLSGPLQHQHYKYHLPDDKNLKRMENKCLTTLRKKNPTREKKQNRKSNHEFSVEYKNGKINSNECFIEDFFKPVKDKLSQDSTCIGTNEHMCINWNTSCESCKKTFPCEDESKTICYFDKSGFVAGQDGLFSRRDIKKDEYICRYIGNKLQANTEGEYIVKVHGSLFIDGSKSTCLAKKANHSCQPNCVLQKVSRDLYGDNFAPYGKEDWETELWIKAIVNISKNEEITYNYGNRFTFDLGECLCGKCKDI